MDLAGTSVHRSAVGTTEDNFSGPWQDTGPVEDLDERDAGPFRGADRRQPPGFAIDGRVEGVAPVPPHSRVTARVSAGMRDSL